ncbi:hypothetical protein RKD44_007479 [Streptomyces collinus]
MAVPVEGAARRVRGRRPRRCAVHTQLPAGGGRYGLPGPEQPALAVPARVVARRGGAVLPGVARAPAAHLADRPRAARTGGGAARRPVRGLVRGGRRRDGQVGALGVLRLPHPSLGTGRRCAAGPGRRTAAPHAGRPRRGAGLARPGLRHGRGPRVRRRDALPRPSRAPAGRGRPTGPGRRMRAHVVRCGAAAGATSARVARRTLLRLVPVALAAAGDSPGGARTRRRHRRGTARTRAVRRGAGPGLAHPAPRREPRPLPPCLPRAPAPRPGARGRADRERLRAVPDGDGGTADDRGRRPRARPGTGPLRGAGPGHPPHRTPDGVPHHPAEQPRAAPDAGEVRPLRALPGRLPRRPRRHPPTVLRLRRPDLLPYGRPLRRLPRRAVVPGPATARGRARLAAGAAHQGLLQGRRRDHRQPPQAVHRLRHLALPRPGADQGPAPGPRGRLLLGRR